jgi:malate dehydrogenase (oxaloacetate-decarboxylating)
VDKKLAEVRIAFIGCGAANVACTELLFTAGVTPESCLVVDSKGILNRNRTDLQKCQGEFPQKWRLCQITNAEQRGGGIGEAMEGADVVIAFSTPGPDIIRPEWVTTMAKEAIVFACANPIPEIWPWEAKQAGAVIVATGRSDFPNQVNNSLGFPGIFRGTLDVRARTITDEMCLAAAGALTEMAVKTGLARDRILPTMEDWEVFPLEAAAVAVKAVEQGIARIPLTYEEAYQRASTIIKNTRELTKSMLAEGFIEQAD